MFDQNEWRRTLKAQLVAQEGDKIASLNGRFALLFQVELGLRLLEYLDLRDEPITVLWIALSGLPIPDRRLVHLTPKQHQALMVARVLLPFSSRSNWEDSLRLYAQIPEEWRCYRVEPIDLETQLVATIRLPGQRDQHIQAYDDVLCRPPDYVRSRRGLADPGEVRFDVTLRGGGKWQLHLDLDRTTIEPAQRSQSAHPFRQPRKRLPMSISYTDLEATAEELDKRLIQLGHKVEWLKRVHQHIHYSAIEGNVFEKANTRSLEVDGVAHVVGMVGSGKSTLMKLIAAHAVLFEQESQEHVTLVVGSTSMALEWAEELNQLLADEKPVAIPVLGRTERDRHLREFYNSGLNEQSVWSLRWLSTACPLIGSVPIEQIAELPSPVVPGREPCETIDESSSNSKHPNLKLCPLFHACPSHQAYQDMISAPIWITTPGGLASSSVPLQIDSRRLKLGELIYEHSDLVIIDEADTVLEWFDNEYAREIVLRGRPDAIFNRADRVAADALHNSVLPPNEERWVRAERLAALSINNILRQISHSADSRLLRKWIGSQYFTAFTLFERLTRRLCGLKEWSPEDDLLLDDATRAELESLRGYFDFITERDPLLYSGPIREQDPLYRLVQLMRTALAEGADAIRGDCIQWIRDFVPDIESKLARLNAGLAAENQPRDSLETLALRLAFSLNVALLDRHLRIMFYEWYNQPEEITDELDIQPYRPIRLALSEILPVPPIGRVFGTYYANNPEVSDDVEGQDTLSRFEYQNIGRWYILNYHHLLEDLGFQGPNVLLMSATTWLPDSTRWHLNVTVHGVLEANPNHFRAITNSTFAFIPQRDESNQLITVSGSLQKLSALRAMSRALLRTDDLWNELVWLNQQGKERNEFWADRCRLLLLVNSYPQARAVAETLAKSWPGGESKVYFLQRSAEGDAEELAYLSENQIRRSDIEDFAQTGGDILVAPMKAIGRGYNVLNQNRKAAFGAVYFLMRPMPHPFDVQAIAAELNHRTLQWCKDVSFAGWKEAQLIGKGLKLRQQARAYWRRAEMRMGYRNLSRPRDFSGSYNARRDLAATTLGQIVQAAGRLVRGGVPFHGYFVDTAWAPKSAAWQQEGDPLDSPEDSLLTAVVMLLSEYVSEHELGAKLYAPFEGLLETAGFYPDLTVHSQEKSNESL